MFFDEIAICERINDKKYDWIQRDAKAIVFSLFK